MRRFLPIVLIAGVVGLSLAIAPRLASRLSEPAAANAPAGARGRDRAPAPSPPTRIVVMEVGGMVCSGCVAKIHHELSDVRGVASVDVDLERQRARVVCGAEVADTALTAAVRRAGPTYLGLIVSR